MLPPGGCPVRWTIIGLGFLTACVEDKGFPSSTQGLVTTNGTAVLSIEVDASMTSFLVTGVASELLAIDSIRDGDGETILQWDDWYTQPTYLTAAVWPLATDLALNWPVRAEDVPLSPGIWEVEFSSVSTKGVYLDGVKIEATTQAKSDADLTGGTVKVVIAYAEGVDEDVEVVSAVEDAVERWREVWGPVGLSVSERYATTDIPANLPYVGDGHSDFEDLSDQVGSDEVLVIVGETIRSEEVYYGVSGNIPGSLISTPRSAVTIGWLANSGLDGSFSPDDIRLMGETMAHEVSHYAGLFHPVETTFELWDAVSDTVNCEDQLSCEHHLGDNLMFPYPVCSTFSCTPQDQLTEIQAGIAHRYTGTQ